MVSLRFQGSGQVNSLSGFPGSCLLQEPVPAGATRHVPAGSLAVFSR